jgi:hypothetical protein
VCVVQRARRRRAAEGCRRDFLIRPVRPKAASRLLLRALISPRRVELRHQICRVSVQQPGSAAEALEWSVARHTSRTRHKTSCIAALVESFNVCAVDVMPQEA